MELVPGVNTVRVTVEAPDNDGYGGGIGNRAYGSQVDDVDLMFGYIIRALDGGGEVVATKTAPTTGMRFAVVLRGLEQETSYRILISAQNSVGTGSAVAYKFMTKGGVPGTPVLSSPVWEATQRLVLSWSPPISGGVPIAEYRVSVNNGTPTTSVAVEHVVGKDVLEKLRADFSGGDVIP